MDKATAKRLARRFSMMALEPGDVIKGPAGHELYRHPRIVGWGQEAIGFMFDGAPVGVVIYRADSSGELRYCDREGRPHSEDIERGTFDQIRLAAMVRMGDLIKTFLGERHPLAERVSANRVPA